MATIQKKSFWQQYGSLILILGGIIIGAVIGAFAPAVGTTIKPIGDIFLNLLFTIVVPLVFVSIASAVGSMANMKRLGKILGSTIGTFIFTGHDPVRPQGRLGDLYEIHPPRRHDDLQGAHRQRRARLPLRGGRPARDSLRRRQVA